MCYNIVIQKILNAAKSQEEKRMNKDQKQFAQKRAVGLLIYAVCSLGTANILKKRIKNQPNQNIAVILAGAFWQVAYELYKNSFCSDSELEELAEK